MWVCVPSPGSLDGRLLPRCRPHYLEEVDADHGLQDNRYRALRLLHHREVRIQVLLMHWAVPPSYHKPHFSGQGRTEAHRFMLKCEF